MSTDGYALVIPERELRDAACSAACGCGDRPESQRRACAARVVRRQICVCVLSAPAIVKALEEDFCAHVGEAG